MHPSTSKEVTDSVILENAILTDPCLDIEPEKRKSSCESQVDHNDDAHTNTGHASTLEVGITAPSNVIVIKDDTIEGTELEISSRSHEFQVNSEDVNEDPVDPIFTGTCQTSVPQAMPLNSTSIGIDIDIFDPVLYAGNTVSSELQRSLMKHGRIQPKASQLTGGYFPKTKYKGKDRHFSEHHYYKKMPDGSLVNREWLAYSTSANKVYCMSCMLFGTPAAQRMPIVKNGIDDWGHIHARITSHEATDDHIHSEVRKGMYMASVRIDKDVMGAHNSQIAENREVVAIIMQVIIYLATHNDALRGHNETLTSFNRGRFLDLLTLLSKNHPFLYAHLQKMKLSDKKQRVTFMSKTSQNTMINVLANEVRKTILKDIKDAGIFSVIVDTTTDLAKLDQFSLIARFCDGNGQSQERLIALDVTEDATGSGMFGLLDTLCTRHGLDWRQDLCAQAYDGAASMQGEYKGLRSLVQKENPRALYIWCFAHILNLMIVDAVDKNEESRNFFGMLQQLVTFMGARKRTAVYVEQQKQLYSREKRLRRLKHLSNTRWTSHDRAIDAISETYEALLNALEILSKDSDRETCNSAASFLTALTTFKYVLMMLLMKSIFDITTPLSKYLQTKGLDFLEAMALVSSTTKELTELRSEERFDVVYQQAVDFAIKHRFNDNELELKATRTRRKKRMYDELAVDETPTIAKTRYRSAVYYQVLDTSVTALRSRFEQSESILKDLALLDPQRLLKVKRHEDIPDDCFSKIEEWLPAINAASLKNEYLMFAKSYENLREAVSPNLLHLSTGNELSTTELEEQESDKESDSEEMPSVANASTTTVSDILKLIKNFNLEAAFPNLCLAYKGVCTIPPSSASAERSFSKLKLIKTRLR